MAKRSNDLAHDSVGRLMLRLAIPTVVAQVVNALYNIVDRIYIGHNKEVGDLALTGLGICFPIIMFISALSALVGTGGGSRAAIAMGEGDSEGANRILGNCATLMAIISVLATVLFQIFKEPLLLLFGASPNTVGYATDYLGIYLWGTIFVQISLGLNTFITTQGFSTFSMATVLLGAGVNIVLDPVFIFGFGMGVKGAALASGNTASGAAARAGHRGLPFYHAVHRESGEHLLQLLPLPIRRRQRRGCHDHLLQRHAGAEHDAPGPGSGGPAHYRL